MGIMSQEQDHLLSRFAHRNENFTCEFCGKNIIPLKTGCRNHCPFCLASKHVDVFPGDRQAHCHGKMEAYSYELDTKKGLMLLFRCQKCHYTGRNKAADNDPKQPDNMDLILSLSGSSHRLDKAFF